MKIIQSYWSLPSQSDLMQDGRTYGGWPHIKYHYFSMSLSCLLLRRFYSSVELFTDTTGKDLLIDTLQLPYTDVFTVLNRFSNYPPILWALPKLYSYSIQTSPFLHVDSDFFIWKPFEHTLLQTDIVAQSPELNHKEVYKSTLLYLCNLLGYVPAPFSLSKLSNDKAFNAGVLGGTDFTFISMCAKISLKIIEDNIDKFRDKYTSGTINLILEQLLLYNLCEVNKKEISYIIPNLSSDYREVLKFNAVPLIQKFIHLIGYAKKFKFACEQVESRLKYEFPIYYSNILKKLDLNSQDYFFIPNTLNNKVDLSVKHNYARTQLMLQHLKITKNIEEIKQSEIKNIILHIKNEFFKEYCRDIYKLDRCIATSIAFENNEKAWHYKRRIYKLLEEKSQEYILDYPFTLNPSSNIVQTSSSLERINNVSSEENFHDNKKQSYYILITGVNNHLIEEELSGWKELLVHFYNKQLSGNELIAELKASGFSNETELRSIVLDFILSETVYTGRLIIKE